MKFTRLQLKNWRNFTHADVALAPRMFIVGNNGCGKSNFLDALRFLRDIVDADGGGLRRATSRRGGHAFIRSLFARKNPKVEITVDARDDSIAPCVEWHYSLVMDAHKTDNSLSVVAREVVKKDGETLLQRPDADDKRDPARLQRTRLEQTETNEGFRPLANFMQDTQYLHMVPQLLREAGALRPQLLPDDPYGQDLLNEMRKLNSADARQLKQRLKKITQAMQVIKPEFSNFAFWRDADTGAPRLGYRHKNWRRDGTWQNEQQLSDGELRLIGLLWALLRGKQTLLLEEPELSFNEGIVRQLPRLFAGVTSDFASELSATQALVSTHSSALLGDETIGASEVILLQKGNQNQGTTAIVAAQHERYGEEINAGLTAAEALLSLAQSDDFLF